MIPTSEIAKLHVLLEKRGIEHVVMTEQYPRGDAFWIQSPNWNTDKGKRWSVACTPYSYGGESNLLEFWDGNQGHDPMGYLTATEALRCVLDVSARDVARRPREVGIA